MIRQAFFATTTCNTDCSATPCLPMLIALVAQYSRRRRSSNCWMYVKSVSEKTSVRIFVFIITAWKSVVKIQIFYRIKECKQLIINKLKRNYDKEGLK